MNNLEGKHFVILISDENCEDNKNNKDNGPIACGSFKELFNNTVEIKRVFIKKPYRNMGLATFIMEKLEKEAKKQNYDFAILVTGVNNLSSQSLYKKLGYNLTEGFGIYKGDPDSFCFKKEL